MGLDYIGSTDNAFFKLCSVLRLDWVGLGWTMAQWRITPCSAPGKYFLQNERPRVCHGHWRESFRVGFGGDGWWRAGEGTPKVARLSKEVRKADWVQVGSPSTINRLDSGPTTTAHNHIPDWKQNMTVPTKRKSQVPGLQNPLRRTLRRPSTSCQSVQSHYAFPIHESLQSENWPLDWPNQDQQVSTGTCSTWWSCQGITTRSWSRSRAVNMSSCPARWGPNPNWFYRQLILTWMTFQGHGESPDADVVSAFISICRQ